MWLTEGGRKWIVRGKHWKKERESGNWCYVAIVASGLNRDSSGGRTFP